MLTQQPIAESIAVNSSAPAVAASGNPVVSAVSSSPSSVQLQAFSPNRTGMPDQLKSGVEQLSGLSMDDVRVHYNSAQPAQLNAHAYAQGTDIHLGPGQERHLPHEAWHVVQQKQGRVKPTKQLKSKVNINDDPKLEREADVMGRRAVQLKLVATSSTPQKSPTFNVLQRRGTTPEEKGWIRDNFGADIPYVPDEDVGGADAPLVAIVENKVMVRRLINASALQPRQLLLNLMRFLAADATSINQRLFTLFTYNRVMNRHESSLPRYREEPRHIGQDTLLLDKLDTVPAAGDLVQYITTDRQYMKLLALVNGIGRDQVSAAFGFLRSFSQRGFDIFNVTSDNYDPLISAWDTYPESANFPGFGEWGAVRNGQSAEQNISGHFIKHVLGIGNDQDRPEALRWKNVLNINLSVANVEAGLGHPLDPADLNTYFNPANNQLLPAVTQSFYDDFIPAQADLADNLENQYIDAYRDQSLNATTNLTKTTIGTDGGPSIKILGQGTLNGAPLFVAGRYYSNDQSSKLSSAYIPANMGAQWTRNDPEIAWEI